jgi:predicted ATP-binding protein involved in virulence
MNGLNYCQLNGGRQVMPISTFEFTNLGPFDRVEFEFDSQVNVLVGPNNCGKTTALLALAERTIQRFFIPRKLLRASGASYRIRVDTPDGVQRHSEGKWQVGKPKRVLSPFRATSGKHLGYRIFVPALRWSSGHRSDGPAKLEESEEAIRQRPSSLISDKEIIQRIINLDYRAHYQNKPSMRRIIDKIAAIASDVTEGFRIEFAGIKEDGRGFYLQFATPDGKVPLDVLSQGTQSLIHWLARLLIGYAEYHDYPASFRKKPGVLIIDEIDAHLHPSWQRRIIPALTKEFPSLQIFCSTHSPLMLAGLKAGQIHLLTRDKKGKVTVTRNETDIIGWSADEIITSFLGVDSATDLQTEESIVRIRELRDKKQLTRNERNELEALRQTVNQRLLGGPSGPDVDELADRLRLAVGKPARRRAKPSTRPKKTPSRAKSKTTSKARDGKK